MAGRYSNVRSSAQLRETALYAHAATATTAPAFAAAGAACQATIIVLLCRA